MLLKAEMLIRWRMVDGLPQRKGGIRKGKASKCVGAVSFCLKQSVGEGMRERKKGQTTGGALLDKLRNWDPFAAFLSLQPSLPKDTDPVN